MVTTLMVTVLKLTYDTTVDSKEGLSDAYTTMLIGITSATRFCETEGLGCTAISALI